MQFYMFIDFLVHVAVQFVWDCTFESVKRSKTEEGSGCILAHCMGLGKTLSVSIKGKLQAHVLLFYTCPWNDLNTLIFFQLIAFIHTVLVNSKKTKVHTCMVVAPLNTILNWQYEFEMWQEFTKKEVDVRSLQ